MVANSRSKIDKFVMGILNILVIECRSAIFIPSMDISNLVVHYKQIEEQIKQVGGDLEKTRIKYGNPSMTRYEVQDKRRFNKRFSNQCPPNNSMVN